MYSIYFFCHQACYIGKGDLHDASFNSYRRTIDFAENYFDPNLTSTVEGHCQIFLDVYPSISYVDPYISSIPVVFTIVVASLFVIMAVFFIVYNRYASHKRLNQKYMQLTDNFISFSILDLYRVVITK
jgi:hypothetical protein